MAWYDTGTVAVTNGSTTVTGTGTDFISGAQVGEAFLAPDDKLYEIQSITSATVLVLADPYLGSTQSGQDYKIVPTQSLVADLSSQVTDLITDYSDVKDTAGAGKFNDGTVTAPAITFEQDQNNGLYRIGNDNYAMSAGGVKQVDISTTDVELNYSGSKKLATTSTGVDVTGTVTADGFQLGAGQKLYFNADRYFTPENNIDGAEVSANGNFTVKTGTTPNKSLVVGGNGNVSFYEDTGTTAKFVWDSSAERLELGTSSGYTPVSTLAINETINTPAIEIIPTVDDNNANTASIRLWGTSFGTANRHSEIRNVTDGSTANNELAFDTNGTERMRIDSSGNVGIGTASPSNKLTISDSNSTNGTKVSVNVQSTDVSATNNASFSLYEVGTEYGRFQRARDGSGTVKLTALGTQHLSLETLGTGVMYFKTNNSEAMRIDSSGSLLVGTTNTNLYNNATDDYGVKLADGNIQVSGSSTLGYFNRQNSDGDIVQFRKDGSTVGSIGSISGVVSYLVLDPRSNFKGAGLAGGSIDVNNGLIVPTDHSGAPVDNSISLGTTGNRFKDLYLSGGVYLGGTDAVNKLDDYEEGDFTPTFVGSTGGTVTLSSSYDRYAYTKIGRVVTITGRVDVSSVNSISGNLIMQGLPFVSSNLTDAAGFTVQPMFITIGSTQTGNPVVFELGENATSGTIRLPSWDSASSVLTGTSRIQLSITYFTEA